MQLPTWAAIMATIAGLAGIATLISNLGKIFSAVSSLLSWLTGRLKDKDAAQGLPKRTIVAVQQSQINALWWHLGRMGDRPMVQVVGDFNTTNVWTDNVRLTGAILRYRHWGFRSHTVRGDASVKDLRSAYSGNYPIPPNEMTRVRVGFHYLLKHRTPGKRFRADLAIIDQFGNHHWIRGLVFRHTDAMFD
ncbi:hypothetical protein P5X00_40025 (plasmid) [Paraburkholderia sp. A2RO-4L]|uniref:hypothetical protein n=1 Tax=Paraburkholderia sp. A2RO-4L TaxID=3028374 RepID=UPI003DA83CFC